MTFFDLCFDRVRRTSIPLSALSRDGLKVLELAELICRVKPTVGDGFQFLQRPPCQDRKALYVYIRKNDPCTPAGAGDGYTYLTQNYAKALRVMCLRIWADRTIFPQFGDASGSYFPRQYPAGEIPDGAELLWAEHNNLMFIDNWDDKMVPSWVPVAIGCLNHQRRRVYSLAVDFAIAFSLLHEIGHNDLGHFAYPTGERLSTKAQELEADSFAFRSLLRNAPTQNGDSNAEFAAALISGLLSAFMVFQIKCVLEQPKEIFDKSLDGYPSIRERISQLMTIWHTWQKTKHGTSMKDSTAVWDTLLAVSDFHPAYAYVIGTPWKSAGNLGDKG